MKGHEELLIGYREESWNEKAELWTPALAEQRK